MLSARSAISALVVIAADGPIAEGDTDAEIVLRPAGGGEYRRVRCRQRRPVHRRTGDDEAGSMARQGGNETSLVGPMGGRNGLICSLVSPDGARSMASDRGTAVELRPEDIEAPWLESCDHLLVSGYALMREPVRSAAARAVELARRNGAQVSIDLASWSAIRDRGAMR
jgi:hypothetical protein